MGIVHVFGPVRSTIIENSAKQNKAHPATFFGGMRCALVNFLNPFGGFLNLHVLFLNLSESFKIIFNFLNPKIIPESHKNLLLCNILGTFLKSHKCDAEISVNFLNSLKYSRVAIRAQK